MGELVFWIFMSIAKFIVTPSLMIAAGYSAPEVILITSSSAFIGVLIFHRLGRYLFLKWATFRLNRYQKNPGSRKPPKKVTLFRRRIVALKEKFGLAGILVVSGLISVPISAILVSKYFQKNPASVWMLGLAFAVWSIILTLTSLNIKLAF
jgi:hypothetical protein